MKDSAISIKADRRSEQKLNLFQHEVSVIEWMMDIQRSLIGKMLEASKTAADGSAVERIGSIEIRARQRAADINSILQFASSRHLDHAGDEITTFRELLTQDCLDYLRQRSHEFGDMNYFATDLINKVRIFSRLIRPFLVSSLLYLPSTLSPFLLIQKDP